MITNNKTKDVFLTKKQLKARIKAGTLEEGVVYHTIDEPAGHALKNVDGTLQLLDVDGNAISEVTLSPEYDTAELTLNLSATGFTKLTDEQATYLQSFKNLMFLKVTDSSSSSGDVDTFVRGSVGTGGAALHFFSAKTNILKHLNIILGPLKSYTYAKYTIESPNSAGFGIPTVDNTSADQVGTASVEVTASGPDTAKIFNFKFNNLKGATGAKGEQGETGETGATGQTGATGVGVSNVTVNASNHLIVTLTDETEIDAGEINVTSGVVIDTSLSASSENPVQNKVIYTALAGKQDVIDATHKLSADNVDDTNTTNKFVTASEKSTWNGKQDALTTSSVNDGTIDKSIGFDSQGNIVKGNAGGGGGTQIDTTNIFSITTPQIKGFAFNAYGGDIVDSDFHPTYYCDGSSEATIKCSMICLETTGYTVMSITGDLYLYDGTQITSSNISQHWGKLMILKSDVLIFGMF